MSTEATTSLGVVNVRLEVTIEAAPAAVWAALTESIGDWWPDTFMVAGRKARYVLEPKVGGRMFEDAGEGQGLMWGQVITFLPPERLQIAGDVFPGFGGPGRAYSTYELSAEGDGTKLSFHMAQLCPESESTAASMTVGFEYLLAGCLKAKLEGRPEPEFPAG